MKKECFRLFCLLLFTVLMVCAAGVAAAELSKGTGILSGEQGDLTWTLDNSGTLTISGTGDMIPTIESDEEHYLKIYSWKENYELIRNVIINEGVTSIGDWAFAGCSLVESITIPDSVTRIEEYAFMGCELLQSITIPDGVVSIEDGVFWQCTSLQSVSLPDSVINIEAIAFCECTSLQSIIIPDGVVSIGYNTFLGCTSLTSVTIPDSVICIGEVVFDQCNNALVINTSRGSCAEQHCEKNGISHIGERESTNKTKVVEWFDELGGYGYLDDQGRLTVWGQSIVRPRGYESAVKSVVIKGGITRIGDREYEGFTSLQSIIISDGVISIGYNAFSGCTSLQSVTIPDSVTSIGTCAFWGCTSLQSVKIPESVISIEGNAFYGCTSLQSVVIPGSVPCIDTYTFYGCSSLKTVVIRDGVTSIGYEAFAGCPSLINVTIPDSVTEMMCPFDLANVMIRVQYNPDGTFVSGRPLTINVGRGSYASQYFQELKQINYREILLVPTEQAGLSVSSKDGAAGVSAGKTLQLIAAFDHPELINKKEQNDAVIWSAVNAETGGIVPAVTISADGQLKADKNLEETVQLLVTCESAVFGTQATAVATAMPLVKKVLVEPAELFFYVGTDEPQTVKAILEPASVPPVGLTWTPAKKDVVEIAEMEDGVVSIKALGAGKTTVAVKEPGGKNAKLTVNVVTPVEAVELTVKGKVKAGGKVNIMPALSPKNAGNKAVQWSLDVGEDIAAINEKGQLTISKNAPSGTRITVTCTAEGAPIPVTASVVIEVP